MVSIEDEKDIAKIQALIEQEMAKKAFIDEEKSLDISKDAKREMWRRSMVSAVFLAIVGRTMHDIEYIEYMDYFENRIDWDQNKRGHLNIKTYIDFKEIIMEIKQ